MRVRKYVKKPIPVEAIQFTGEVSVKTMHEHWGEAFVAEHHLYTGHEYLRIRTLEGTMTSNLGDWIIKGIEGEFYSIKEAIFKKSYEAEWEPEHPPKS